MPPFITRLALKFPLSQQRHGKSKALTTTQHSSE
jgi:hypothetical protein